MKKRARTLTSFFTPALTPVTPVQLIVGADASNNVVEQVAEQVAAEPTIQVEAVGDGGNTSQEQVISTQVGSTSGQVRKLETLPSIL